MKTVMIVVADKKEAFSFYLALPLPLPLCCCCCCDTNISIIKPVATKQSAPYGTPSGDGIIGYNCDNSSCGKEFG